MKKILAMVLSLALVICSLPAGIIASAADGDVTPYANIGMTLVSNSFDNSANENVPSNTDSWLHTASTGEKATTSWYVNNNMIMLEADGNNSDSAIEFLGGSPSDYPGAFIDLDDQFFGSGVIGTSGYAGLTEGLVITEFDIMANGYMHLALLGTGSTSLSSIASSVSSSFILRADGKVGTSSDVTYNQGEWGRVKVVSNLNEKKIATYYNGKLVSTGSISYGYGIKQLNSENYGLMFQANDGDIDFVIDNFNISYVNKTHLGTASFDSFEMPSNYRLDNAFVPNAYVPKFDFVNTTASIVDGQGGNGDKAMKIAPNGDGNPNYRFYYQNKSYKGATTGVFHGQFDIRLESNFKLTLSAGWGLGFSDEVFSANGKAGSATYNNTDWYHVDVVTDYNNKTLKVYLDGNVILSRSNPSALIPSEYFQIIVWGNADAGSNGVIFDNITFDYYNLPEFAGIAGFKTAENESFVESEEIPSNATEVKLNLSKAFGYVANDDVYVTVDGAETAVNVAANDAALEIAFPAEIGAGKEVSVTVFGSAVVGSCIPSNNEITTSFTTTADVYEVPTEPVNPYAAMVVDELTIFPADGKYVYEEDNLTLKAYAPEGATDVKLIFDGSEVSDVVCYDNMYYAEIPAATVANGEHTLKATAVVNGETVAKESFFNFYSGQTILVYNTFDELTTTPSSSNSNVYTKSAYGPTSSTWTFNNNMVPSLDAGKGGKGNSLRFTNTSSGAYAGAQLALDSQFFGVTTLGKDGYPGGISEGTFVTEFDMKVNTAGQLGFLGLGSSDVNNVATSGGAIQLSTSSGKMGSISDTYTAGKWVHVEVYTNYAERKVSTVVDGKIICDDKSASNPFGNKELWGRYGLMFQAQNAIDVSIDNFVIRYSNVHKIGQSEFDAYTGSLTQPDGAFIPRGYVPMFDKGSSTVELTDGFMGGKALSIAPNGSGNPNYRFYYQNKSYRNATSGVLHTSFDAKLDAFMDVNIADGAGLYFSTKVFGADGKSGNISYNAGEWYHVDIYTDWCNNTFDIYLNDVLALSGNDVPYALLRNEYFQILVYGNAEAGNGALHLDNICFNYYDAPLFAGEATLNVSGDVITVPMSASYASLAASDVTLKVNGETATVSEIETADNAIKLTLANAIANTANAEITIGKNAKLGTLAIQNKTYSAKYDGFGLTIDENDEFVCANVDFRYGTESGAYLDDTLVAEYNHILDENNVLNNAVVSITENGEASNAMALLSVESNKLIISLSGLKAGADYVVNITNVMDGADNIAYDYEVSFSTLDFSLKADEPTVADGVAKADVYSAYASGKTVIIAAATYDGNKLTGVVLNKADVTSAAGEEISVDLTEIGGNADKVFVWNGFAPLSIYTK